MINFFKKISIKYKIIIISGLSLLLLGLAVIIYSGLFYSKQITNALFERGVYFAGILSKDVTEHVLEDDLIEVNLHIRDFKTVHPDITYIFVLGKEGHVLAHTFANGFPSGLKYINNPQDKEYSSEEILLDEKHVLDLNMPLLEGHIGSLHIGFSKENILKQSAQLIVSLNIIVLSGLVLCSILLFFLAGFITKPILKLNETLRKIDKGEMDYEIEVTDSDEIGDLSRSFSNLLVNLKAQQLGLMQNTEKQKVLNSLLHLSLEDISLDEILKKSLNLVLSISWLSIQSKGSIFLAEGKQLKMIVHNGLPEVLVNDCRRIPFGKCICGRVASSRQVQFYSHLTEDHEIIYESAPDHGHYGIPILSGEELLGVLNLYVSKGHVRNVEEEEFLITIADTLAGIIERKRAYDALEIYTARVKSVNKEYRDLNFIISHNLREPLRSINAFSKFVFDDYKNVMNEDARQYLTRVRECSQRIQNYIQVMVDLFDIAQIEFKYEQANMMEITNDLKHVFREKLSKENVEIIITGLLPSIICISDQIRTVFFQLVDNALKFSDKEKTIVEIGYLDNLGPDHTFYVKDNGIGIEEKYFDKIFNIFTRLNLSEGYPGGGAGLAICKKIIDEHHGRIWLESAPGAGSTFYFSIPKERSLPRKRKRIGEILLDRRLVTGKQIQEALKEQKSA